MLSTYAIKINTINW